MARFDVDGFLLQTLVGWLVGWLVNITVPHQDDLRHFCISHFSPHQAHPVLLALWNQFFQESACGCQGGRSNHTATSQRPSMKKKSIFFAFGKCNSLAYEILINKNFVLPNLVSSSRKTFPEILLSSFFLYQKLKNNCFDCVSSFTIDRDQPLRVEVIGSKNTTEFSIFGTVFRSGSNEFDLVIMKACIKQKHSSTFMLRNSRIWCYESNFTIFLVRFDNSTPS